MPKTKTDRKMSAKKTIVIAWTELVWVHDGKDFAADLGKRPTMIERHEPRACFWMRKGTDADLVKAREFAQLEGYTVYTFPVGTRDAIAIARRRIVTAAHKLANKR